MYFKDMDLHTGSEDNGSCKREGLRSKWSSLYEGVRDCFFTIL